MNQRKSFVCQYTAILFIQNFSIPGRVGELLKNEHNKVGIMVTIEVIGTGCANCKRQMSNVESAVKQLGITANIVKVDDIAQIMERGVMMMPAIIIDGDLKISGRVADVPEIKKFLAGCV